MARTTNLKLLGIVMAVLASGTSFTDADEPAADMVAIRSEFTTPVRAADQPHRGVPAAVNNRQAVSDRFICPLPRAGGRRSAR